MKYETNYKPLTKNLSFYFVLQVEIVSCFTDDKIGLCLNSIATKIKETTIIVKRSQTSEDQRGLFYLNGTKMDLNDKIFHEINVSDTCFLKISREDDGTNRKYNLQSNSIGLNILIRWNADQIFGTFNISRNLCCLFPPTGLCGTPSTNCRDIPSPPCGLRNLTQQNFSEDFRIPENESILSKTGFENFTISGLGPVNCVCFKQSSMISSKLKIFQKTSSTLEFFVKTCTSAQCIGTILSYTWGPTFTLRNYYGELIVTFGDRWVNTGLYLENEQWNQVTIAEAYGYVDVYIFNSKGKFRKEMLDFTKQYPVFQSGGILTLGKWQPSIDGSGTQPSNERFEGCIDELRIWNKYVF